jgi:diguanylate cyclase (GGDEF)-like protein
MRRDGHLLVIGSSVLSDMLARALPKCRITSTDNPLAGVWEMGNTHVDGILLAVSDRNDNAAAIRTMRELAPDARIVLTCQPTGEPLAREALAHGADDYIIQPLAREDVEKAFEVVNPAELKHRAASNTPTWEEIRGLSEILQQLADGGERTIERLAELVRDAFHAVGASIQIDDMIATVGRFENAVLEESILRSDRPVGRVALAAREEGGYSAADASRLGVYARFLDSVIGQARDQAYWRELAWTDDLSGLRNRRYFEQSLDELVQEGLQRRLRITVFLFDIDDFKSYNDHYGHAAGDGLIREVGELLTRCTRDTDVVSRYGGDEFAVIFWDAEKPRVAGSQHPSEPIQLARRFCSAIRNHAFDSLGPGAPGPVTISGGIASFPWDGKTASALVEAADRALLAAKKVGKNRIALAGGDVDPTCTQDEPSDGSAGAE